MAAMSENQNPGKWTRATEGPLEQSGIGDDPLPNLPRRRMEWGTVGGWLLLLAVIGGVAWYLISAHLAAVRNQRAAEIKQQQQAADITALVLRYNAVTNWQESLPDRGLGQQPFSIDVSRALIGRHQQPVLIECNLNDVFEKDGRIVASLSSTRGGAYDLSLELQCNPEQVKTFTGLKEYSHFAVVARCHEVQRLSGEDGGFSVKGELLDAIKLP
jgi:hypothetical protein